MANRITSSGLREFMALMTQPPQPPATSVIADDQGGKVGPHWGGFWPAEYVPELDDVCFEPAVPRKAHGQFEVYSAAGELLGSRGGRWEATSALRHWKGASFVVFDGAVVARREDAAVTIGQAFGTEGGAA